MSEKQYIINIPLLMSEWCWEENDKIELNPKELTCFSHKKAWWKCSKGHKWQAAISHRNNGRGCPYCTNKLVIKGQNDLCTVNPIVSAEWNYEKNNGLTPLDVLPNSNKKVWWKCSQNHEWQATISHRNNGQGCPYCQNKKTLSGYNDLQTSNPELIDEWDFEKNKDILPTTISKGSSRKVWWKCCQNHSWQATIYSRVAGSGCPTCINERQSSYPEKAIYFYVKQYFLDAVSGYKLKEYSNLEIDIFIPQYKIGIEYDGERWHQNKSHDIKKNTILSHNGISLIRIREPKCPILNDNKSINIMLKSKRQEIEDVIKSVFKELSILIKKDISIDINLQDDNSNILGLLTVSNKTNSVSKLYPQLLKEWNYNKNMSVSPNFLTPGSDKKVWWRCKLGHDYYMSISSKTRGRGCPICSGKIILPGYNDLESKCPELLSKWDYKKNTILPSQVSFGSDKKFWWLCKNNHSYIRSVNNQRTNQSCPICKGRKVLKGFNDITTTHPDIIEDWCYELNTIQPTSVSAGSHEKVWWKCSNCGHKWQSFIYTRTSGHGCPKCNNRKKNICN